MFGFKVVRQQRTQASENWHESLLPAMAAVIRPVLYVEIGIYQGTTFRAVARHAEKAIGVDINPGCEKFVTGSTTSFICGTSRDVGLHRWILEETQIDLAFIDGDHSFESVKEDFLNLVPYLSSHALVCFHDTYPANHNSTSPNLCGDAYRFPEWCQQYDNGAWNAVTFPRHPGLTVVGRSNLTLPWQPLR